MVALVGTCVLAAGAYLQFGEDHAGASAPTSPAAQPSSAANTARGESRKTSSKPARTTPSTTRGTTKTPVAPVRPARPTGIAIRQLGVQAPVLAIKAVNAALTPPSDPTTVGWWSGGAQPGARRGSAVITGHTVHSGGGAFDNLGRLVPGSVIEVSTVRGVLRYQVATVTTYRKATLAKRAAQVFDQSVAGRLVLVTCEDWNGEIYLSNVVVIALAMA